MNQLQKYLNAKELERLKDNPGLLNDIHKHLSNQVYKDSNFAWQRTQIQQIIKGAEKYDEPLNPKSWTPKQLVEHALQENVDQVHYLVSLGAKVEELEERSEKYKEDAIFWRKKYMEVTGADEEDLIEYN